MHAAGQSQEVLDWIDNATAGVEAAVVAGQIYWRESNDAAQPARPAGATSQVKGKVYILTDSRCASACLDAVDLWKALGAEQIGRETSADTVYMEIRSEALPSGLANIAVPMKVWRGRARGNNEPQKPSRVFTGDMADDAAVLTWVEDL